MLKKPDFVISTLLVPVFMLGAGWVGNWVKAARAAERHRIVLVQAPGAPALPAPERVEWVAPPAGAGRAELETMVRDRHAEAALVVPPGYARGDTVHLIVRRGAPGWTSDLRDHLSERARLDRAAALGLGAAELERLGAPITFSSRSALPQARTSDGDRLVAVAVTALLIMSLFVTGMYMAVGISGEKQARVTEVVVSAIRPEAWMDGKIVAYSAIGVIQAVLWGAAVGGLALFVGRALPALTNPTLLAVTLVFALLGFALYCALFALVMATVKDLQSTSKLQAYLIFLPAIPFFVMTPVLRNPDATWVMVLSQVPFFSPILMPMRFAVGAVHAWELGLALVLLVIGIQLMRRAAGFAFRVGMLMYGKELTLPELWRWSRGS